MRSQRLTPTAAPRHGPIRTLGVIESASESRRCEEREPFSFWRVAELVLERSGVCSVGNAFSVVSEVVLGGAAAGCMMCDVMRELRRPSR